MEEKRNAGIEQARDGDALSSVALHLYKRERAYPDNILQKDADALSSVELHL